MDDNYEWMGAREGVCMRCKLVRPVKWVRGVRTCKPCESDKAPFEGQPDPYAGAKPGSYVGD